MTKRQWEALRYIRDQLDQGRADVREDRFPPGIGRKTLKFLVDAGMAEYSLYGRARWYYITEGGKRCLKDYERGAGDDQHQP